jgi:hypothetical protein
LQATGPTKANATATAEKDNRHKAVSRDDTLRKVLGGQESKPASAFTSHPARGVPPPDPLAEKRRMKEALEKQVAELQADLDLASAENERLRQMQSRRRSGTRGPLPLGRDDLLRLLSKHLLPPEAEPQLPESRQWLDAAMNPIAWLPFGKLTATLPALSTNMEEELEDLPPPKSHHAVSMTAQQELPFLQVFTPLSFSSRTVMLPRSDSGKAQQLQRHHITVRSSRPPGLFTARIEMTVDAKHLAITDLVVPKLDPAAAAELGPFVDGILRNPRSSAATRNVSIISWAMSEWFRIAVRRARFWSVLEAEVSDEAALLESVAKVRSRRSKRVARQEQGGDGNDDDEDEAQKETNVAGKTAGSHQLLPHIGRTSMEITVPGDGGPGDQSWLRVEWKIQFDWTGEARSSVAALVGIPGKCECPSRQRHSCSLRSIQY